MRHNFDVLTPATIDKAKANDQRYDVTDGGGLALKVMSSGSKTWRFKYHLNGKREKVTSAACPAFTVSQARVRHEELCALVERGQNPAKAKRAQSTEQKAADSGRMSFCTFAQFSVDDTLFHRAFRSRRSPCSPTSSPGSNPVRRPAWRCFTTAASGRFPWWTGSQAGCRSARSTWSSAPMCRPRRDGTDIAGSKARAGTKAVAAAAAQVFVEGARRSNRRIDRESFADQLDRRRDLHVATLPSITLLTPGRVGNHRAATIRFNRSAGAFHDEPAVRAP